MRDVSAAGVPRAWVRLSDVRWKRPAGEALRAIVLERHGGRWLIEDFDAPDPALGDGLLALAVRLERAKLDGRPGDVCGLLTPAARREVTAAERADSCVEAAATQVGGHANRRLLERILADPQDGFDAHLESQTRAFYWWTIDGEPAFPVEAVRVDGQWRIESFGL